MMSMYKKILVVILVILFALPSSVSFGQETPQGPVYVVQSGDSLWGIAQRFGVSMTELASINNITDPNQLSEGMTIIIPGLEGLTGKLTTRTVNYGESLRSLSRYYQIPVAMLARLNHIVSSGEVYAGYSLVITENEANNASYKRARLESNQSLLEFSVLNQTNPWKLVIDNQLSGLWAGIPSDELLVTGGSSEGPSALPGEITGVEIDPLPLLQGKVFVSRINAPEGVTISGQFMDYPLHFFSEKPGTYVSLQGVHAMTDPGLYPLSLVMDIPDRGSYQYSQMVNVGAVDYPYDQPLTVDPTTIDPEITGPEDNEWRSLTASFGEEKLWDGKFNLPSPLSEEFCLETNDCWSSMFGNRRSYNGSTYSYFHTGLDIVGKTGTEVYAAAAGVVVYTGTLTVRGNATMIDHGWGVYTGYLHQSEILVSVGDQVEAGQLIGKVGDTGRVEGPHLHWEVWAGGVQVDPLDWLKNIYP
jgi:murein DD-endopeptidase MepM/ murein hydrolase activator NlpD